MLTSSVDHAHTKPVISRLRELHVDVVELHTDRVRDGRQDFRLSIEGSNVTWRVDGRRFASADIGAAWWRKPHWLEFRHDDPVTQRSLEAEYERLHYALAATVPQDCWLNEPAAMRAADSRLAQLQLAARIGLATPSTLVTNAWSDVEDLASDGDVAFKTLNGTLQDRCGGRVLYTKRLRAAQLPQLCAATPYPGVFQSFVAKRREWRVTVVGRKPFSAVVTSTGEATTDWREYQFSDAVSFRRGTLPKETADACVALTRHLGLRFAAIDLIERADGRFVFLEANPNGQFAWLEDELRLGLYDAVVEELMERLR